MGKKLLKNNILILCLLSIGLAFGIGYTVGVEQGEANQTIIETVQQAPEPITNPKAITTPQPSPTPVMSVPQRPSPLQICFSPQQNCEGIIVHEINAAKESIYIQAYSFTSQPIICALQNAQERHVNVQIILDGKTKAPDYLLRSSLPIYIERMPGLAHNKVMIIDQKIVLTGSYNFTKAAAHKNAENLIRIKDPTIARQYLENWQMHFKRAQGALS